MPHRTNPSSYAPAYAFDEEAHVYVRAAGHDDLHYSDGDLTEEGLLALVRRASDRSLHSPELAAQAVDWPTRYHLSPVRANLLRPFERHLRGRTLEVGSGCGVLTRYLGELGGEVVAVEGSRRRAAITAARCRGLDNVTVFHERLERFAPEQRFSAITLVGVLEWASRFGGTDGARRVLEQAARLLTDEGVLIIAIENQLGLKYFAGWPEDHLGVAMGGVNDTYRPDEPRTFGRRELGELVTAGGFPHHAVYAAFPDYKFPRVVVSPSGLDDREWRADLAAIAAATPVADPQAPTLPLFSLEQALGLAARNGLLGELSNSFVVLAGRQAAAHEADATTLAWHFTGHRRPQYLRETRFRRSPQGLLLERRLLAQPLVPVSAADDAIRHRDGTSEFLAGEVWTTRLGPIVNRPGWTITDVAMWAAPWLDVLSREAGLHRPAAIARVPSHLVDATPFNLVHANGQFRFFDLEWEPPWRVEYGYALFRGLFWSLARFQSVAEPAEGVPIGLASLCRAIAAACGSPITPADESRYLDFEANLQHEVSGVTLAKAREDLRRQRLRPRAGLDALGGLAGQVETLKEVNRQVATSRDDLRHEVDRYQAALQEAAERREAAQEDFLHQLAEAARAHQATKAALEATHARLEAAHAQLEATHARLDAARAEADATREQVARERDEVARLSEGLRAAEHFAREQSRRFRDGQRALRRARGDAEERGRRVLATAALVASGPSGPTEHGGRLPSLFAHVRQWMNQAQLRPRWAVRHPLAFALGVLRLGNEAHRAQLVLLSESLVFDLAHYRAVAGAPAATDLLTHFLRVGDAANRSPHPLFDADWYRRQNPDLPATEGALMHYLRHGGWELRNPHPLFDARYYLAQWPADAVRATTPLSHFLRVGFLGAASPHPLFDAAYYVAQRPDLVHARVNPLVHYLATATSEAVDPHPLFSTRHYLETNPDVRGPNPLDHFVRHGASEARSPHPLFDIAFYWQQRPDVFAQGENALLHYLRHALDEDVDPHPLFDTSFYLEQAPDLRELGINPLVHFLHSGWRDGLKPNPWFDPRWYLDQNPDLVDVHPLVHFALYGWREGRDPSPDFSLSGYLGANPDVAVSGQNGLQHYIRHGHGEGRQRVAAVEPIDAPDLAAPEAFADLLATVSYDTEFRFWMQPGDGSTADIEASIQSLKDQLYLRWRLDLVVIPGASVPLPASVVDDARVRWVSRPLEPSGSEDDEHDSFASRLHPGDVFEPHALLLAAHVLEGTRNIDLVYTDEDTLGPDGRRDPVFKPDWDPLLLASTDYLGPGAFVRSARLRSAFERMTMPGGEMPPDRDVLRRALEGTRRERAVHLPFVLAHASPRRSYAARMGPPPVGPALAALADRLYGPAPAGAQEPLVSIIIPTKNRQTLLSQCVESVLGRTDYPRFEIIVVDNGSDEDDCVAYLADLEARSRCRVLRSPGPFNYSALNNLAAAAAQGELFCLLNNDIEIVEPSWLSQMVSFARQPRVGAVGTNLYYPDGTIQHGGVVLGAHGVAGHAFVGVTPGQPTYMNLAQLPREISAVTGACMVVAREKFQMVGGLDEQQLRVNFNDIDLCLKLHARGYSNVILPLTGIVHHESATRGADTRTAAGAAQLEREATVMKGRWGALLREDPYYNGNLSLTGTLYDIATSPRVRIPRRRDRAGDYTSLGREPRLDIYASLPNPVRVDEATAPPPAAALGEAGVGLSVIVLTRDAPELICPLVRQLEGQRRAFAASGIGFEVLIGDTGSTDPAVLELYADLPDGMHVVRGLRYHFSRCNNDLETRASFDTVLFLNNDIIFTDGSDQLLRAYRILGDTPGLGVLGSVMFYPDGSVQHMGCQVIREPRQWGLPYHVNTRTRQPDGALPALRDYPAVTGAFLMMRRRVFHLCGRFDPAYRAECQDTAVCFEALRLGYRVACAHLGHIVHIENGTRPPGEENWRDRQRLLRKFGAYIQAAIA